MYIQGATLKLKNFDHEKNDLSEHLISDIFFELFTCLLFAHWLTKCYS